ncbi:hypothetical protein EPIR_2630 [Erwinia piriflorinigrans CFBP 5888]|uniref:Uncharacterized protein n=1 Tax=Erwinia piriflorinigrans CFBP 5888 TaxID=1161919 RepID=V5Z9G9_9GAMM|nr:hypothetical protein EPIR_2630 [Erwinia piriflorinigrans CFBP 5888]
MFRITSGFEQAENAKILSQFWLDHETLYQDAKVRGGEPARCCVEEGQRALPQQVYCAS